NLRGQPIHRRGTDRMRHLVCTRATRSARVRWRTPPAPWSLPRAGRCNMLDVDRGETGGKARGTPMMKPLGSLLALTAVCAAPALAANPVRISQIYGGGGNTTGTPTYKE